MTLYWLDNEGKRHAYGTLSSGDRASQNTFASHVWLVAGPDDRAITLFVAGSGRGQAIIQ